jgi:hypothetical protein
VKSSHVEESRWLVASKSPTDMALDRVAHDLDSAQTRHRLQHDQEGLRE